MMVLLPGRHRGLADSADRAVSRPAAEGDEGPLVVAPLPDQSCPPSSGPKPAPHSMFQQAKGEHQSQVARASKRSRIWTMTVKRSAGVTVAVGVGSKVVSQTPSPSKS